MAELLEVSSLSVSYGAVRALRGISLEVREGEIVTLLGANGAGKSSLLRAVMRTVPLDGGDIRYRGASLLNMKTNHIVKSGISLVPEGRGILGTLSVLENLELGAYHQPKWKDDLDRIFGLFPILKDRIKQNAGTLSGGEQQMLAIGRALLARPRLLLLDEPSLGLAPKIIQNIFKLIEEIRAQGISILLIEQNAHMGLKVADRAYLLETGDIVASGNAAQFRDGDATRRAYLGG